MALLSLEVISNSSLVLTLCWSSQPSFYRNLWLLNGRVSHLDGTFASLPGGGVVYQVCSAAIKSNV